MPSTLPWWPRHVNEARVSDEPTNEPNNTEPHASEAGRIAFAQRQALGWSPMVDPGGPQPSESQPAPGPVPCKACERLMSAASAVCPHCGTRTGQAPPPVSKRTDGPRLAGVRLTPEETAALLTLSNVSREPQAIRHPGLIAGALLPHRRLKGAAQIAEIALLIVGFPLAVASVASLALGRLLIVRRKGHEVSELETVIAGVTFGAPFLFFVVRAWANDATVAWIAVGVSAAASILRAILRWTVAWRNM